jgi:hypothetical protein
MEVASPSGVAEVPMPAEVEVPLGLGAVEVPIPVEVEMPWGRVLLRGRRQRLNRVVVR